MKRITTILTFLMLICMGAWADELPASTWNISTALPTDNWVAMGENTPAGVTSLGSYTAYYRTQEVTLSTAGMINVNFLYSSGDHKLEILGVDALNASSEVVASDYHFGYTGTNKSLNDYFLNGLSAGTYTLRYIINGNLSSSVGNITFRKFEADVVSSLPELTTDVNNPKYYSIGSYDRDGYFTSNGAGQSVTHVAFGAGSSWYFTAINGNNSGSVIGGVIAHCSDGTQLKQNWQTAASGQTVYILPNGYNTYGFCISKTFPISSSSCCDANNRNTGVGNWTPASDDWRGTTWVFKNTVPIGPTGYYYFKGMDTNRHPYLYSDFVTKGNVATYHHDLPSTPSNGHIWKVTNSGTTFTIINGEGLPLTTTPGSGSSENNPHETLTLRAASAGPDYYFTEAINLTAWGNDTRLTTWDGHPDANDNKWTFELVDVSAGVYDVVVLGNNDGYVTYSDQNAKNGGFFVASSIAVGDLTAYDIDGYTEVVSVEGHTITVSYNKLISYTLTDVNGATYEGTYNGPVGVTPTFTGCSGYTLTNESWSGTDYSATINFPFAVSSNDKENLTFIGQFKNKASISVQDYMWQADGTNIRIKSQDLPPAEHDKYLWSIIPAFSNGAFTFTIKNKSTGTYVKSTCTENRHNEGDVTLSETATSMTYNAAGSTGTCNPINAWYLPSIEKYLSASSVNSQNQFLGVWGTVHDGISTGFPTYGDLISSYWSLKNVAAQIAKAGQYGYPLPNEENTVYLLWVKGAMDRNIFDGTKANYSNLSTWYEGFLAADVVTPVAGDFLRIKASDTNKSAWSLDASNLYLTSSNSTGSTGRAAFVEGATATDNTTIFYYNGTTLTGFANGLQPINNKDNQMQIGTAGATSTDVSFEVINKTEQHAFRVEFKNNGRSLYTQRGGSSGSYYYHTDAAGGNATDAHYRYFLEKVTSLPITFKGEYASFYSPVDLTIPDNANLKVYTGTMNGNKSYLLLSEITTGTLPANTGVILHLDGWTEETSINFPILSTVASGGEGDLSGTITAASVTANSTLVLGKVKVEEEDVWGIYKYSGTTLGGFKAYMNLTDVTGGEAKGLRFIFDDSETTGISSLDGEQSAKGSSAIYDLQGRKVANPSRGMYIINGRVVVVK